MKNELVLNSLGKRGLRIDGAGPYMQIGLSVGAAGDFNGDGIDDFVISGPYPDIAHGIGISYVLFGTGSATLPRFDLRHLSPSQGFAITGPAGFDGVSIAATTAGDVDGDGYDDLLIGTPRYDDDTIGGEFIGRAYILYGHAGPGHAVALDTTSDRLTTVFESKPTLGGGDGPELGTDVRAIGDINGDGRDDFAISAPVDSKPAPSGGRLHVIYGGAALGPSFDLDALTPAQGFTVSGTTKSYFAAISFAGLGDVNGDRISDVALTAYDGSDGYTAYLLYGKAGGLADMKLGAIDSADGFRIVHKTGVIGEVSDAGDVNGDGYADILVGEQNRAFVLFGKAGGFGTINLSALAATDGFKIIAGEGSPTTRVSAAGDFNGDGYDDVALFNYGYYSGYTSVGYVIYGHAGSFGTIDATTLDPASGFTIRSGQAEDYAGYALRNAGDVNDDGTDDLLVGAREAGNEYQGAAYLLYGQTPEAAVTRTGTEAGQRLAGGAGDDVLAGLGGDDVLYGNAGTDSVDGGDGDDVLDGGAGADRMTGGLGDDVYRVDAAGDTVTEAAGAGRDTVEATVDWALGKNFEDLLLRDGAAIAGKGNSLGNVLTGNANANILSGLSGDDVLIGGAGGDRLTGGAGHDVFQFDTSIARVFADADRVTDFAHAEDRLDLSSVDGVSGTSGVDPFTFVGTTAFTGHVGDLRYEFVGRNTIVSGDTDGDRVGDVFVRLDGRVTLDSSDFTFASGQSLEPAHATFGADRHGSALAATPFVHLDTAHHLMLA